MYTPTTRLTVLNIVQGLVTSGIPLPQGLRDSRSAAPEVSSTLDRLASLLEQGTSLGAALQQTAILGSQQAKDVDAATQQDRHEVLAALRWHMSPSADVGMFVRRWPLYLMLVIVVGTFLGTIGLHSLTGFAAFNMMQDLNIKISPVSTTLLATEPLPLFFGLLTAPLIIGWCMWSIERWTLAKAPIGGGEPLKVSYAWIFDRLWAVNLIQAIHRQALLRLLRLEQAKGTLTDNRWHDAWDRWWISAGCQADDGLRQSMGSPNPDPILALVSCGVLPVTPSGAIDWDQAEATSDAFLQAYGPVARARLMVVTMVGFIAGIFMGITGWVLPMVELVDCLC